MSEAADGHTTNSTILDGSGGDWDAKNARASCATVGDGKSKQSSFGRPNFATQISASCLRQHARGQVAPTF